VTSQNVLIVGAGFVGLEVASVMRTFGAEVTVVEASSRPMSRALSADMSRFFIGSHAADGVRFMFDAQVVAFDGADGRVTSAELDDGRRLAPDLVLNGIGVVPNQEIAKDCGLATSNGIEVDGYLATSDPGISAIGDCTLFKTPHGAPVRLESVQNAVDQAKCCALRIVRRPEIYASLPWFWSDQAGRRLQIAGLTNGLDRTITRGDPSSGKFSVFCFLGDRLLGVESVNSPADHLNARRLLGTGRTLRHEHAADPAFDLKVVAL
jgi:3-phenylpropionate/trans-cinnamate dioxygenase ferredoxin reductase subunit